MQTETYVEATVIGTRATPRPFSLADLRPLRDEIVKTQRLGWEPIRIRMHPDRWSSLRDEAAGMHDDHHTLMMLVKRGVLGLKISPDESEPSWSLVSIR